mmetsp:Transcript_33134/g.72240  ORF Transcript_33134/g.72240 Transcript_33134/m.72240 type:complete len:942 (-) Transcript_33134:128-2953(-)
MLVRCTFIFRSKLLISYLGDARRGVGDHGARKHDTLPVEDGDPALVVHVHDGGVTLNDLACEDALREAVLEQAHDGAAQGTGTVARAVSLIHQPVLETLCDGQVHALLLHALEHLVQHNVRNLLHLQLGQLTEHDDLVETVKELGAEVVLQLLVHQGLDPIVAALLTVLVQLEAEAATTLLDHARANVGGHDDECVLEVDGATLGVGQTTVLENLQHHVEHIGMGLLDLVEQHHGVGTATDGLGKLTTLVVSDVAGGRADELGDGVALHELGHIQPHHGVLRAEVVGRQGLAQLGLADTGGAGEDEAGDGPVGVLQAHAGAADGASNRDNSVLLADDATVESLLHVQQLGGLVGRHLLDGDAGPASHNLSDVRLGNHGTQAALELSGIALLLAGGDGRDLSLELHLAVAELTGLLEVLSTDRRVLLLEERLELLVKVAGLLRESGVPQAHTGASLVHKIDSLVGEETVRDVLVSKLGSGLQRLISVGELVVGLVTLAQTLEDVNAVINGGLGHNDGLETTLKSGILLNVLAVLVKSGRADALQLATGKGRLQDVGSVDGALGRTGADESVHLVDDQDDVIGLLDLVHELLQALLELTTVLGARNQQTHVQGDNLLALDGLGHVTGGDQLSKALSNSGLTHTGLADQARVVLGATAQNLGHTLDLLAASHHGVEPALLSLLSQVGTVLLESGGLVAASGRTATGHAGTDGLGGLTHHADDLGADLGGVGPKVLQDTRGNTLTLTEQAEQEMLGANVVVSQLAGLLKGQLKHTLGTGGEGDLHGHEAGPAANDLLNLNTSLLQVHTHRLEHLSGNTGALTDQTKQNLLSANEVVTQATGLLLGKHNHLDRLLGEALEHGLCHETLGAHGTGAGGRGHSAAQGRAGGGGHQQRAVHGPDVGSERLGRASRSGNPNRALVARLRRGEGGRDAHNTGHARSKHHIC